jgi:Cof subfamily protein (haloacid dehalogenase superfamily)
VTPPIRLLALDIDGTLLDSNFQLSTANLAALRRAHESGVEVVLTTGRRHTFALPVAAELGFDLWLISSNGAVTRSSQGELFHRDLLPSEVARDLMLHMGPFRDCAVVTFDTETRGALLIEFADALHASISRWMEKNAAFIEKVPSLPAAIVSDPVQAMFCGTIARMREVGERLASFARLREVTVLKTEYEARDLCMIDLLNQGCTKGHALKRWAGHRGLDRAQVMAIGDNYNDVEMLDFAGVPFIMENACAELKQNGWQVTLSNDQSGVAAALASVGI